MSRRVLLVGDNVSSFISNAICDALKTNSYEVSCARPDIDVLDAIQKKTDIYLLYAGEFIEKSPEVLIYLKDICTEHEKMLYVVGYNNEINEIRKSIPDNLITAVLERPLNVKFLTEVLNADVDAAEKEALKRDAKKHILVVDDSGIMLRAVKSWLSRKYKVSMANSGAMAIAFLASNRPDLILLDYEMPICSGPQVMEMIHAEPATSDIPVMFLTAKDDEASVRKVLDLKPVGYLLKTMSPNEIVDSIDRFFEKQKK